MESDISTVFLQSWIKVLGQHASSRKHKKDLEKIKEKIYFDGMQFQPTPPQTIPEEQPVQEEILSDVLIQQPRPNRLSSMPMQQAHPPQLPIPLLSQQSQKKYQSSIRPEQTFEKIPLTAPETKVQEISKPLVNQMRKPLPPLQQPRPQQAMIKKSLPLQKNSGRPPSGIPQKLTIKALAKLEPLLEDATIQTIECPGPGKSVLVYKSGVIQATSLVLTNDEINKIMQEISEKTKIPIISGIFKAAYDNLIATAVMSEFIGTRFMIQKKVPEPQSQQ